MKTICKQLGIKVKPGKPFRIKDENGNTIYYENCIGYWRKRKHDENNNEIYYEDSYGCIRDNRPKTLTMDEIANKFNIPVENLKIEKG